MKSTTTILCARILVWLTVAATLVAVLRGASWGWMLAALGLALTADLRDLVRWPARAPIPAE
jgi:hypothetical protein